MPRKMSRVETADLGAGVSVSRIAKGNWQLAEKHGAPVERGVGQGLAVHRRDGGDGVRGAARLRLELAVIAEHGLSSAA